MRGDVPPLRVTVSQGSVCPQATLHPGGAAFSQPKFLRAGDTVRVEIERLGAIVAHCVDEGDAD